MSEALQHALFAVAMDPGDEQLDRLRSWYESERISEITRAPGVTGVTTWEVTERYVPGESGGLVAVPAQPAYVAIYKLHDAGVARSDAFLDAVGRGFDGSVADSGVPGFETLFSVTLTGIMRRVNPGCATGPTPTGMLVVSLTPERGHTELFHQWYDEVHLDELLGCPGFLSARRYKAVDGIPNYFAFYDLDRPEALKTSEFLGVSGRPFDQLPAIQQRVGPHLTSNVCDVYRLLP